MSERAVCHFCACRSFCVDIFLFFRPDRELRGGSVGHFFFFAPLALGYNVATVLLSFLQVKPLLSIYCGVESTTVE